MRHDVMICKECGAQFLEPLLIDEGPQDDMYPNSSRLYSYACPECGSSEVEDANMCGICGEPTLTEFCPECIKLVNEKIDQMAKELGVTVETMDEAIAEAKGW
jgi:RNA polymerase subunit RPABC4/transcription elongation factor Spt4